MVRGLVGDRLLDCRVAVDCLVRVVHCPDLANWHLLPLQVYLARDLPLVVESVDR